MKWKEERHLSPLWDDQFNPATILTDQSLRAPAAEVGQPIRDDGPASVRRVVWDTLTSPARTAADQSLILHCVSEYSASCY